MLKSNKETQLSVRYRKSLTAFFGKKLVAFKYHADEYAVVGHADIYGHASGHAFFHELKVDPGRPTEEQRRFLVENGEAGASCGLVMQVGETVFFIPHSAFLTKFTTRDRQAWIPFPSVSRVLSPGGVPEHLLDVRILTPLLFR